MKFIIDANIPKALVRTLTLENFDIVDVYRIPVPRIPGGGNYFDELLVW